MKQRFFLLGVLAFVVALLAFSVKKAGKKPAKPDSIKKNIVRCSPDWNELNIWIEENDIPPVPGAGSYAWKISTKNDSAQFYFNQGINMYYSFHIIEAMASFKKAKKFDPACGMLHWAEALAYGPNINDFGYTASPDALAAINKALDYSAAGSEKERMLIEAQRSRYSTDTAQTRASLNQLYAGKMKEVYDKYPGDADVAALFADALMLQHPWDLWNTDGTPRPWTPLIREVLEKLLAKTPGHPGANHYYIHVMEPSPYAYKALPSADRLGKLTPGLSHTVHMPSHIYLRTGHYDKGVSVNENAVTSYLKSIELYAPVTGAEFLYRIHNLHMQTNNAMLAGRETYSVQSAIETVNSIPKDYLSIPGAMGSYVQYISMTPVFVDIRFGRWNELLQRPAPAKEQVYANLLLSFARGMAHAAQSNLTEADSQLAQLRALMKDSVLSLPFTPFSPAIDGARVAENLLAGRIALQKKQYEEAIAAFQKATDIEANMVYNEPRDWLLNPSHYLGLACLEAGRYAEAEKVFRKDLQYNNDNIWSVQGLYEALTGSKKTGEAKQVKQRLGTVQKKSGLKNIRPVF